MVTTKKDKKIKWNKSQLIESDHYVRVFIKSLSKHFTPTERQEIYFISKLFVDGTIEVGYSRFESADHFFSRGEALLNRIDQGSLMKMMLTNIYDRSKSLYYYRLGEYEKAIDLIYNALETNKKLEAQGFTFMAFDRFSQYHNLSKIYFSRNQFEKGLLVLSDVISFLMNGMPNHHIDGLDNFLTTLDEDGINMRSSLLCTLLFETTASLQKDKDYYVFKERSAIFFEKVLHASKNFLLLSKIDHAVKKWLDLIDLFYSSDGERFTRAAGAHLESEPLFYGHIPRVLVERYLNYFDRRI